MSWWQWVLLYLAIAAPLLVFWHAAVTTGKRSELPGCFNSNPGPQERAENDCLHCEWNDLCLRGPARFTKEDLENR